MKSPSVNSIAVGLLAIVLFVVILVFGKPFLVPITVAVLLSLLLLPACNWLERKGVNKVIATICSMLLLAGVVTIIVLFVKWQVADLLGDASKLGQRFSELIREVQHYVRKEVGIPVKEQQQLINNQSSDGKGSFMTDAMGSLVGILMDVILITVYIFLFLYFRARIKRFIIQLVTTKEKNNTLEILHSIQGVTQQYLTGLALMIMSLWILYSIGFTIVGVENAVFFAILCGLLELVPFVGNITGTVLTILMSMMQGGDGTMVIGILITYGVIQFFQSYVLEPLVVGAEVNINPLFTILGLVAGEMVWGISGMILAIPLMGITKIVFDHIESLKPYGDLMGRSKSDNKLKDRIMRMFRPGKG